MKRKLSGEAYLPSSSSNLPQQRPGDGMLQEDEIKARTAIFAVFERRANLLAVIEG